MSFLDLESHSMHPVSNYRQSRRSACDRCRGFKLRCERDQVNGRSCERCLKAQVVCTTSIGHLATSFPSSNTTTQSLTSEYGVSCYRHNGLSVPAPHKPSLFRVRKRGIHSGIMRKHPSHAWNTWGEADPSSYLANASMSSGTDDLAFLLQSSTSSFSPPEPRQNVNACWDFNFQPESVGPNLSKPENFLDDKLPFSHAVITGSLSSYSNELPTDSEIYYTSNAVIEPHYSCQDEIVWNSSSSSRVTSTWDDDPRILPMMDWKSTNLGCTQMRLLKLNLELIDDLEVFECESTTPSLMNFLGARIDPTVSQLDVSIFRMLNHSSTFLEMLDRERAPLDACAAAYPATESIKTYSYDITQLSSKSVAEEVMDDGIATVSSHDSGYLTETVPPQETSHMLLPEHRLPVFLEILTTYCQLIRLYHAIFTQLYQMFLIVPPPEGSSLLLLSGSQYAQIGMGGTFTVQIQALIEISFKMLAKLEHLLELLSEGCSGSDCPASPPSSTVKNTALSVVREQIVAHEGIVSGIPLRETMACLDQLVKASADQ